MSEVGNHVRQRLQRSLAITLALVAVGFAFWLVRSFEPTDSSWYPKCVFHYVTGLHCPGCGATRALYALAHGDIILSLRSNAMLILGLPLMLCLILLQRRRERMGKPGSARLAWSLLTILTIFFIVRNVPSPTRSWLAPPMVTSLNKSSTAR